jgi:hypothetical protein
MDQPHDARQIALADTLDRPDDFAHAPTIRDRIVTPQ